MPVPYGKKAHDSSACRYSIHTKFLPLVIPIFTPVVDFA